MSKSDTILRSRGSWSLRHEMVGLGGVIKRNVYPVRRYIWWDVAIFIWTVANTLSIVFIARGIEATGGTIDVNQAATSLLIGAVIWAYLGIIFELLTETVAWERWEGTIEYTFMAPLSGGLPSGRAVCKAARQAEAERLRGFYVRPRPV